MKARWMSLGIAVGLALALMLGWAFSSDRSASNLYGTSTATLEGTEPWAEMDAMHEWPEMRRFHAQMPEELQAQCDAMHARMGQTVGGDMSSHHAGMKGGRLMDPGLMDAGGMMGSGGGMMGS